MYTNGFDIEQILPAMRKRLGWRQPAITGSPTLSGDNKESASGRFFQSFHPLVTLNNIKAAVEEPNISDDHLNEYLVALQDDAIIRALNEVFREPELLEQKLLYTRAGSQDGEIINSGKFVGYEINVANDFSISSQINSVSLYLNEGAEFNLYLFQDGVQTALKTIPVTVTAYERTEVDLSSVVLNYKSGNKYYFGYFQADLGTAKAIQEQVSTWATSNCFGYSPIVVNGSDFKDRQYSSSSYGLNLEVSAFRDHTQKILRKANFFDEAVGLTVALMVIEQVLNSTRANQTLRLTQEAAEKLFAEMHMTLPKRIESEYTKLKDTFFPKVEARSHSVNQSFLSGFDRQVLKNLSNPSVQ